MRVCAVLCTSKSSHTIGNKSRECYMRFSIVKTASQDGGNRAGQAAKVKGVAQK